jgi:hypothetical protein
MEKLTLQNLCGGELDLQFQAMYPELIARCAAGESASMTVTIEFERVKDTATMVTASYKMKTRTPAFGRSSLCVMDANFGLSTEPIEEIPQPISLFKVEGGQK